MAVGQPALEHGSTRAGRWLRGRRIKIALWIAVVEGVLIIFDQIAEWLALVVGAAILGFYLLVGRNLTFDTGRQVSWIAALSQVFVALVPALLFFVSALAILVLAVLAVVALIVLFADRR
jgi:hypothetical protein